MSRIPPSDGSVWLGMALGLGGRAGNRVRVYGGLTLALTLNRTLSPSLRPPVDGLKARAARPPAGDQELPALREQCATQRTRHLGLGLGPGLGLGLAHPTPSPNPNPKPNPKPKPKP